MIYYIGNKDLNICKIGFSERPHRRIETIRAGSPFELTTFDIIEGDRELEGLILAGYEEYKVKGEWFQLDKVNELGLTGKVSSIKIGSLTAYYEPDRNYLHAPSAIAFINGGRMISGDRKISFSGYQKAESEFLQSFRYPWVHNRKFVHPFVYIDIFRYGGSGSKLFIYENLSTILSLVKKP